MFGEKKDSNRSNTIIPSATTHALNSLVQGTVVTGDVKAESDVRIDGSFKGNLVCTAKVIIGPSGAVDGDVSCQNAVLEGKFTGNLIVSDTLQVKDSAHLKGKIKTGKLIVQAGAVFNVTCEMGFAAPAPTTNGTFKSNQEKKEVVRPTEKIPA
jgi:cytoskeletal protein CcmA (bactofilin family)